MIPRVYIDTSVIGGCLDEEFKEYSERLFRDFVVGRLRAVVSDLTLMELAQGPPEVQALLRYPVVVGAELVTSDEESVALAEEYIRQGVVRETNRADALHIAIATVRRIDLLVSWNFEHIVRWSRIRAYNAVNLRLGYPELEIRSPQEVAYGEDQGV